MVEDIFDGLKRVAEGIKSVSTIVEAIKSGRDYVTTKHPDVRGDLRLLVDELRKSLLLIKRASAVMTNFRFAVSADSQASELARFNDYFIQSKEESHHLYVHIDDLRTHCRRIREHAAKIGVQPTKSGFPKLFALLGLSSPERERELGEQLDRLAYEDYEVASSAELMLHCLQIALTEVQNALGDGGVMLPENVPNAAALLARYGPEFEAIEERAALAVKDIRKLVEQLE